MAVDAHAVLCGNFGGDIMRRVECADWLDLVCGISGVHRTEITPLLSRALLANDNTR